MMTEFCPMHGAPHAPNDCAECDGGERAMKTAKEWAESVVIGAECDGVGWAARIEDAAASAWFETEPTEGDAQDDADRAIDIIERLVERVQADARAQLEEEIARLKTRNDYVEGMVGAYESVIAGVVERLSKSLEPGADAAACVREVIAHLKALVTL